MTSPAENRADAVLIGSLVSRLASLQMKSMAPGTDLKTFGLESPAATVRIGAGSSQATLLIGKAAEEGTVYAKDASRPNVFTIESSIVDELKKKPEEYRQKDIFDARAFNTTRIEVTRGSETTTVEKSGDKWKQLAPAAKDVDTAKAESLLSSVTSARAISFVDKAPTAKPDLVVLVKFDSGKEERVSFYKVGAEAFAVRAGSTGAAKIDPPLIDDMVKALEALK
jgi:hypothetical protein